MPLFLLLFYSYEVEQKVLATDDYEAMIYIVGKFLFWLGSNYFKSLFHPFIIKYSKMHFKLTQWAWAFQRTRKISDGVINVDRSHKFYKSAHRHFIYITKCLHLFYCVKLVTYTSLTMTLFLTMIKLLRLSCC